MRAKKVYEAFQRNVNPRTTLGINLRDRIKKGLAKEGKEYTLINALEWLIEKKNMNPDDIKKDLLLDLLQNLSYPHIEINEALEWAIKNGYTDISKFLMGMGGYIPIDNMLLSTIAHKGYSDILKYFIKKGLNIKDNSKFPLMWAADGGHLDTVKILMNAGADIHAFDDTPLIFAAKEGHLDVVKYLIKSGAHVHAQNDDALKYAILREDLPMVKYLVQHGANIKIIFGNERTGLPPLINIVEHGNLDILKFLIKHGAGSKDINSKISKYRIKKIRSKGYLEMANYLESIKKQIEKI